MRRRHNDLAARIKEIRMIALPRRTRPHACASGQEGRGDQLGLRAVELLPSRESMEGRYF